MQMKLHAKPSIINGEVGTKPSDKEPHQNRVRVRKGHRPFGLAALSGVQRQAEHRQITARQRSDERIGLDPASLDLGELADVERMRLVAFMTSIPRLRNKLDVANPDGHRTLRDAEFIGDLLESPRIGAQLSSSMPFDVFATISHGAIMTNGCGRDGQVEARIGSVGDWLPPAGSSVTPSTNPVGSTPSRRSSTTPPASGRKSPADVAASSATSHSW